MLLVFTPVYWNQLPVPGSAADRRMAACKARAAAVARSRPRGDLVDLRVDGPKVHDRANFFDATHYREPIARDIEAAVAERLNALSKAPYANAGPAADPILNGWKTRRSRGRPDVNIVRRAQGNASQMFKLIEIILALTPVFFLLRSIIAGQVKEKIAGDVRI